MSMFKMTKTLVKSLFHGPYTVLYPVNKKDEIENVRGKVNFQIENCTFCTLCQKRCPTGAIEVNRENKKWSIDRLECIQCSYCVESCPKKCLSMDSEYSKPSFGRNQDEYARVSDHSSDH